jgi:hypothetical protein
LENDLHFGGCGGFGASGFNPFEILEVFLDL